MSASLSSSTQVLSHITNKPKASNTPFVARLLLWHGRNAYSRTAHVANFVFHRGLIISVIQVPHIFHVFATIFSFRYRTHAREGRVLGRFLLRTCCHLQRVADGWVRSPVVTVNLTFTSTMISTIISITTVTVTFSTSSYTSLYTMLPVLSLLLDEDVSADTALTYPEL
jgi:hypothetical protein